jgi:hypothetical protein
VVVYAPTTVARAASSNAIATAAATAVNGSSGAVLLGERAGAGPLPNGPLPEPPLPDLLP